MDNARTFQLEEFKALRKELEITLADVRTEERYIIIASGLVWGWLIVHHNKSGWLWAVPILLSCFIWIRTLALNKHISLVGTYLKSVETSFGVKGWEHRDRHWSIGVVTAGLLGLFLILAVVAWFYRDTLAS